MTPYEPLPGTTRSGRLGEDDLVSILTHARRSQALHVVRADESFSVQPGTSDGEASVAVPAELER